MDLSKLYYERDLDSQQKLDAERIITGWVDDVKEISKEKISYEFKNIKMKEIPTYCFEFAFQKVERNYAKVEKEYNGDTDFTINPISLDNLFFDSYPIENIEVSEEIFSSLRLRVLLLFITRM